MKHLSQKTKYAVFALSLCTLFIIFSADCMNAALSGFNLWLAYVMPSLFPFFVCMALMKSSGLLNVQGKYSALSLYFCSAVSGAPSGSRLCSHLHDIGAMKTDKLSYFCAICNMASPAFILGTLSRMVGGDCIIPILVGHYGASLILILLFSRNLNSIQHTSYETKNERFFTVLCECISEAVTSVIKICGVIIFFTVILSILLRFAQIFGINIDNPIFAILLSTVEMTNGCALISTLNLPFSVICALLCACVSFGGLCIMTQTGTFFDIDVKKYLQGKLTLSLLAGIIAYIVSQLIPKTASVFSNTAESIGQVTTGCLSLGIIALSSLISSGLVWLFCVSQARRE